MFCSIENIDATDSREKANFILISFKSAKTIRFTESKVGDTGEA